MKIGYKGFEKGLICREEQFEVGKLHAKPIAHQYLFDSSYPRLCTDQGYHYCDRLADVDSHYSLSNVHHVFAEIEVLGPSNGDGSKSITTAFKIRRIIPRYEIEESIMYRNLNIEVVKKIQEKFPTAIISGSAMLFLRGVRLTRWASSANVSDLDIVLPYYEDLEILGNNADGTRDKGYVGHKYHRDRKDTTDVRRSGMDFDQSKQVLGVKCDVRIDPKAEYEIVEYMGHKYKVASLWDTLAAKCRYATQGGIKHMDDIEEMLKVGKFVGERATVLHDMSNPEPEYPF